MDFIWCDKCLGFWDLQCAGKVKRLVQWRVIYGVNENVYHVQLLIWELFCTVVIIKANQEITTSVL